MSGPVWIACKKAAEPLDPGHWRGYFCRGCGVEVQVSPTGRLQLDQGGQPYCIDCGFTLAKKYADRGVLTGVTLNPAAQRTVAEMRNCDFCGAFADRMWLWRTREVWVWPRGWPRAIQCICGLWGACEECRPLFAGHQMMLLAVRASIMQRGTSARALEQLYEALAGAVFAGPIAWRRGDPMPKPEPEPD